ncbi:hypothetical protein ATK30_6847 [Amycolatopsis echigonensis]|uniref:Phage terminase large subunit-like protein n=1 Tax=Amycolatopsis echigonensis TaxID=2576905 RepID=A0A2N3WPX1_9PSEU|nr:hypothetical protein [Amycolatopsis niigatensis]PKV95914.1 hypothetical protein ATK30_6847 [Amycolatopsis niigatensis]
MFDLTAYLAGFDPDLLADGEGRRILTRLDPLLFALTYLPHHLRDASTRGQITLSEFHTTIVEHATTWARPSTRPLQDRDAYVAPRGCGKSTWLFLILPLWAAAHGHRKFAAAFADSGDQAQRHLQSFKGELQNNELLRADFPGLCTPARKPSGGAIADNQTMYVSESGFVFGAKGIDSSSLGMKVGSDRPDLIILDDIEPDESNYSLAQKTKRLTTLLDAVLPLNIYARVVLVGTVTMPESIVHQLVRSVIQPDTTEQWVRDTQFRAHYFPAIMTDDETGQERSLWPAKWPLEFLQSIRHTRDYKKNYANDPLGLDGEFFTADDFVYGELPAMSACLLSIDPAVTSKEKSDFTAVAVIGAQPARHEVVDGRMVEVEPKKCVVRYAQARRVQVGEPLRQWVLALLAEFPEISGILIEVNQGGQTWTSVLHDMPVRIDTLHNTLPKEVRAARLATRYQMRRVLHAKPLDQAEAQLVSFPKAPNDDLVDAIGNGVARFLGDPKPVADARQYAY